MKKIVVILLLSALCLLCACNQVIVPQSDDPQPSQSDSTETTEPEESVTIDWETPIDMGDAVTTAPENVTDPTSAENTDPVATDPSSGEKITEPDTGSVSDPTTKPATDPVTEPDTTPVSDPTVKETTNGPIHLPMIPG